MADLSLKILGNTKADINNPVFTGSVSTTSLTSTSSLSITSSATTSLSVDSGTTGPMSIGTGPNAKTITIGNTTGATGVVVNSGTAGVTFNQVATGVFKVAASVAPTTDMVQITNAGMPNITAGVNALEVTYVGGAANVEASAMKIINTPGTTSGGIWSNLRISPTAAATTGVTQNGVKFDSVTAGLGTGNMLWAGTGWDNILSYNGSSIINGTATSITGSSSLSLASITANAITLDSGTTGAVNIGNNANAKTITIGNNTGVTAVNITTGTGNLTITSPLATISGDLTVTGGDIKTGSGIISTLFGDTTTGNITIAGALTTGTLTVGAAGSTGTVLLFPATGSQAITLGGSTIGTITIGGGANTINVGSTGANTINIGSASSTAVNLPTGKTKIGQTTLVQGGAVSITLPTTAGTLYSSGGTDIPVSDGGTGVSTLTGIVKGNGTSAFSAATAGTDYTSPAGTENLSNKTITASSLTLKADPTIALDAATKQYVDNLAAGLDVKQSVKVATTSTDVASWTLGTSTATTLVFTTSAPTTIDGYTLVANDRVLVKDLASPQYNGIYVYVAGLTWTRSIDADTAAELNPGMFTFVEQGATNADSGFVLTTDGAVTLGTTSLTFVQFSGAGQITAGAGITKNGNTLSVAFGGNGSATTASKSDHTHATVATQTAGSATVGALAYNGTTAAIGQLDGGTVAPTDTTTRLNFDGVFYASKVYNAVFNDYAEYFLKDDILEAGDVVIANPNGEGYIKSRFEYDSLTVGVLSDDYAQCIGGDTDKSLQEQEEKYAPIGMSGRVRVKAIGDIKKGDLLIASNIPGVAMTSKEYKPGTVIGKALENHTGDIIDRIKMLIINM